MRKSILGEESIRQTAMRYSSEVSSHSLTHATRTVDSFIYVQFPVNVSY